MNRREKKGIFVERLKVNRRAATDFIDKNKHNILMSATSLMSVTLSRGVTMAASGF